MNNAIYLFRENCFDLVVNSNDKNIILSNYQSKEDMNSYIKLLSEFYKINQKTLNFNTINLEKINQDKNLLQLIPNKKQNKFDKDKYTLLQISS